MTLFPSSDGCFCRSSCQAPRDAAAAALRSAAAADALDLRPCPRCRPERVASFAATATAAGGSRAAFDPQRLAQEIREAAVRRFDAATLARRVGLPPAQLARHTEQAFGASPTRLLRWQRLVAARRLLDDSDATPATVARLAGFASAHAMQRALARRWPDEPQPYRQMVRARRADPAAPVTLWLPAVAPFAGALLNDFLTARALPGVETASTEAAVASGPGYVRHWRTVEAAGSVRAHADAEGVALHIDASGTLPIDDLLVRARRLFDTAAPAPDIAALLRRDARLAAALRSCPGRRVPGCWDPFELAVRAVLGQQVSVAAARTHAVRLVALCAGAGADGASAATFPDAAQLARTDLDGLAMPGARKRALTGLANAVADGVLDFGAPMPEVRTQLLAIPGIGPWTADYISMRALRDPDAFPAGDLVVRQALREHGELPSIRATMDRAEPWRPFRAYAVMHLWATAGGGG